MANIDITTARGGHHGRYILKIDVPIPIESLNSWTTFLHVERTLVVFAISHVGPSRSSRGQDRWTR